MPTLSFLPQSDQPQAEQINSSDLHRDKHIFPYILPYFWSYAFFPKDHGNKFRKYLHLQGTQNKHTSNQLWSDNPPGLKFPYPAGTVTEPYSYRNHNDSTHLPLTPFYAVYSLQTYPDHTWNLQKFPYIVRTPYPCPLQRKNRSPE